jgi:hypothetical protein
MILNVKGVNGTLCYGPDADFNDGGPLQCLSNMGDRTRIWSGLRCCEGRKRSEDQCFLVIEYV